MPARQVAPPLVVTTKVPPVPLAHATRALTGLMACSRLVVPLCCGVRVGAEPFFKAETAGAEGAAASEQASAVRTIDARIDEPAVSERIMEDSPEKCRKVGESPASRLWQVSGARAIAVGRVSALGSSPPGDRSACRTDRAATAGRLARRDTPPAGPPCR